MECELAKKGVGGSCLLQGLKRCGFDVVLYHDQYPESAPKVTSNRPSNHSPKNGNHRPCLQWCLEPG